MLDRQVLNPSSKFLMSKHNGLRGVGVHPPEGETMGLTAHSAGLRMVSMRWDCGFYGFHDCGHGNVCDRQGRCWESLSTGDPLEKKKPNYI